MTSFATLLFSSWVTVGIDLTILNRGLNPGSLCCALNLRKIFELYLGSSLNVMTRFDSPSVVKFFIQGL